eukprot:1383228-Amphidinium_carterae.2
MGCLQRDPCMDQGETSDIKGETSEAIAKIVNEVVLCGMRSSAHCAASAGSHNEHYMHDNSGELVGREKEGA